MSCPFFKEAYVGYCGATAFPYIPSICELEHHCFKDGFESCTNFDTAPAVKCAVEKRSNYPAKTLVALSA